MSAAVETGAAPASMAEALDREDPQAALLAMALQASKRAESLAQQWQLDLNIDLPELLRNIPNMQDMDSHPIATATACTDSIRQSLTKISTGGSQASQEIKQLEQEKRELEEHAQDVETALILRRTSDTAARALSAERFAEAAKAIQEYTAQKESRLTDRAKMYAGEYTVTQLESTQRALQKSLMEQYQQAVEGSDLMSLGKLTPLVQMVQIEREAVELYLRFLKEILSNELTKSAAVQNDDKKKPPYAPMARVYNSAVTILRHHLPMVSHCLHRAAGDVAVVQLVHVQVQQAVSPLFQNYIKSRQLGLCSKNAQQIYVLLEDRLSGGLPSEEEQDDCGFASQVGALGDVDAAMEEAALMIQHTESYTRFIEHTVKEVNKARALRHEQEIRAKRQERERMDWASTGGFSNDDDTEDTYKPVEILSGQTQLHETVAEVGGYYSVIERCLLLASMQRAFTVPIEDDPQQYLLPIAARANSSFVGSKASQTSVVESCLYAARRATQRAFATGHTGTASAMANYCADCLRGVFVNFLTRRAEEWGVTALKPGEGLLEGSAGLFNYAATQIILQGQQSVAAAKTAKKKMDLAKQQAEVEQGIAVACATLNDIAVAAQHCANLQTILERQVETGFPPNAHETEQLLLCVASLGPVVHSLESSSKAAAESLASILKPRIRAIVTDAVGGDNHGPGTTGFSLGGAKSSDRHMVRMNYELDEEAYQLLEVSEGYLSRV